MSRLKLPFVPAADRDTFTGTDREITFDPVNTKLVIHDGVTPGGFPLLTEEDKTNTTKAELTKTFTSGEEVVLSLEEEITAAPVVSATKEVPQIGVTNNSWDVASDGTNYTLHDTAYSTTLTPSDASADGTFTLGTGSFAPEDVGKRIEGNGGVAFLTATDGSYKIDTPFNDTSTISDWSMFALDVESAAAGLALSSVSISSFDLSSASYNDVVFDASSQDPYMDDLKFSNNGDKMYLLGNDTAAVYQYTLSTAFDINTASYDNTSFNISNQASSGTGISFNNNGTKMYVIGSNSDSVYQYSLNVAFDVSSASYDNISFDISSQDGSAEGVVFNDDGSKMYISGGSNKSIYQYSLTSFFDISSASYDNVSFDVEGQDIQTRGFVFNDDGSKFFLLGRYNDAVFQYSLSTNYEISTASFDNVSFDISSEMDEPQGITFNNTGSKFYVVEANFDAGKVYQYSSGSFSSPTSANHTAITSTSTNTEFWVDINSMTADDASNEGSVYYAVSTDDRTTWSIIDDAEGAERAIVRNNGGTWEINDASDYGTETWVAASENDEFYALEEAVNVNTAQTIINIELDVSSANYTENFLDISASTSELAPKDLAFSSDGTKLYIIGLSGNDSVRQFDLQTPYDITTASYNNLLFDVSGQGQSTSGLFFSSDNTKMFMLDETQVAVFQYTLSDPLDVSTASYDNVSFSLTSQMSNPTGISFDPSGNIFYVVGESGIVFQYSVSTAFDISSASYSGKSFDVSSQATGPKGVIFDSNGEKMLIVDGDNDTVFQYSLSTPFDVSTASYSSLFLDVSFEDAKPNGLAFNNTENKLFVVGDDNNKVYEYFILRELLDSTNRMDAAQLNAVSDANHYTLGDDLDLAITMTMPDSGSTSPTSDGVSINYDAQVKNAGAILGTDYEWDRPAADTVNFKALSNENFKIRVV